MTAIIQARSRYPAVVAVLPSVWICIPARNEQALLPRTLRSVALAARAGVSAGSTTSVVVSVVVHRSSDQTLSAVEQFRRRNPDVPTVVSIDHESETPGAVRRRAVDAVADRFPSRPADEIWIFNTDADSIVPEDWIVGHADAIATSGAAAVAGMCAVISADLPRQTRRRHDALVRSGVRGTDHDHVYGANLVVRLDAYRRAGGFADVQNGEDHALVRSLRAAGVPVLSSLVPPVRTSGRRQGRAEGGLASLLSALSGPDHGTALPSQRC